MAKQELPYMHDLSIFVGRKYYDKVPENMDFNELVLNP